jgi:RNA polymerase sigma-70 factor (ECF subfamily)
MKHPEVTDREYVRRSQAGDRDAFSQLVRRYQDRLYRFLLRLINSREEALELTQDTFIQAWQALPDWRPDAEFRTWLFRIGSNAAMDCLRRRKVVEFVPIDDDYDAPSGTAGPEAQLQTKQRLQALEVALGRLPPDHREIVLLRDIEDMSYSEIGAVLSLNEGTVKSRLARAREALINDRRRTNA